MKNATKLTALALAAVMSAMTLSSCGSSSSFSKETINIGGIGPITDAAATYGLAVQHGAEIAVKEINEKGGVNGVKLAFEMQDDVNDAEKAVTAYNNLKDDGMQILLGTVTTTPCLAVVDKTKQDNMFQITPSASSDKVIANDNCFQVCFSDPNQGVGSAEYIANNKIASKIGVIYDSSDAYSSGIFNNFKAEATKRGLNIVTEQSFTKDSKTSFTAQVNACKTAGAELIFLPIYYTEASLILNECKSIGYAPKFFGCDGLDGLLAIPNFDKSMAEGIMLLTPFAADAKDEATQNFVKAYKEAYNEVPNQFAADAYDAIYVISELIEKGKITADMSASDICNALKTAITSSDYKHNGLTGNNMTWAASGAVSKDPKAVVIKDGAYSALE